VGKTETKSTVLLLGKKMFVRDWNKNMVQFAFEGAEFTKRVGEKEGNDGNTKRSVLVRKKTSLLPVPIRYTLHCLVCTYTVV